MLEEHDTIDMIAQRQDGGVELVIMDAGLTEDPQERFDHLLAKLQWPERGQ